MTESRKFVIRETALVAVGEAICVALMYGVYALLGKFGIPVLLGGLVGALLATGNFFFLAVIASLAADRAQTQEVADGQKMVRSSYLVRLLVLAGLLILCAKSGFFDLLALLLPLVFMRPVLMISDFFRKKGA